MISSAEFKGSACAKDSSCVAKRLLNALGLRQPASAAELLALAAHMHVHDSGASDEGQGAIIGAGCQEADAKGLYSVPASFWG